MYHSGVSGGNAGRTPSHTMVCKILEGVLNRLEKANCRRKRGEGVVTVRYSTDTKSWGRRVGVGGGSCKDTILTNDVTRDGICVCPVTARYAN